MHEKEKTKSVDNVLNEARITAFGVYITQVHVPPTAQACFMTLASFVKFLQGKMSLLAVAHLLMTARDPFTRSPTSGPRPRSPLSSHKRTSTL